MKNFKNLLKDKNGFSLITVLVAFSILTLSTYIIFDLTKKQKVQGLRARSVNIAELERNRISSFLSNKDNCKEVLQGRTANLQDPRRANSSNPYTTLLTNGGTVRFLTNDPTVEAGKPRNSYYNGALNLTYIDTEFINTLDPDSAKLKLEYIEPRIDKIKGTSLGSSGRPDFFITIDLHVTVDGSSKITECYAITQTKKIKNIMTSMCAISAAVGTNIMTYNITSGLIDYCKYDLDLSGSGTCPAGTAVVAFDIVNKTAGSVVGNSLKFDSSLAGATKNCAAFSSNCASNERVRSISNGQVVCQAPGTMASDPSTCANGNLVNRISTTSISCVNTFCPGADDFINSIPTSGATCVHVPTTPCSAGTFARGFNPDGSADCKPIPVISGDCFSNFGVHIKRDDVTYNGTLQCGAYSKSKTCPAGTYLSRLDAAGNAICDPY